MNVMIELRMEGMTWILLRVLILMECSKKTEKRRLKQVQDIFTVRARLCFVLDIGPSEPVPAMYLDTRS